MEEKKKIEKKEAKKEKNKVNKKETKNIDKKDSKKVDKKAKKENKEQKEKKAKKERKPNKFIEIIKKKWLIDGTRTFLLVAIIITLFIGTTLIVNKMELEPLDFTQEKLYSLTDESKEKVKNIDKEVKMYFIGHSEEDPNLDLAKQYHKVNEKITAEAIDVNERPDLANKYGVQPGMQVIAVECGEKTKMILPQDLMTYDMQTGETVSIAEKRFTSTIQSVTSNEVPKVYFLEGFSAFSLGQNMNVLASLLANEINEIASLDILSTGAVPEDCDTLAITTPSKDFDEMTTNAIIKYIESGKNILWLNAAVLEPQDMPNVNKVLAMYGVKPFEKGMIRETNKEKMLVNSPNVIKVDIQPSELTKDLYGTARVVFLNATKINVDTDKLEELNVEEKELMTTGDTAFFRTNFENDQFDPVEGEEKKTFTVGAEFIKTLKEKNEEEGTKAVESKLVLYGENLFTSDMIISPESRMGAISIGENKDVVLNSIAYLVDRPEDITVRKNTGVVTYNATEMQDTIVRTIIFVVPILIIITGIIVWQVRRRKK